MRPEFGDTFSVKGVKSLVLSKVDLRFLKEIQIFQFFRPRTFCRRFRNLITYCYRPEKKRDKHKSFGLSKEIYIFDL